MATHGYYRKKKVSKDNLPEAKLPGLNSVMCWGARGLGKRLGLTPLTNLVLTIVKDEE